jgi:3'-phosphoadenosine 5'-phosphosulfate sulfotransferase (PAPS reductase)/FAD synthetase
MADADPRAPWHEPAMPVLDEEAAWVHETAERFEDTHAGDLLEWALDRFHPKLAISAAGGVDGMVLIDMAWRLNPEVRVFTLDTGRLPPETYSLFEEVREHEVPYHELFDHGYTSIGCAPCTRPVQPGEPERAGRWWWEQDTAKECGIHCSVELAGSQSDREKADAGAEGGV